MPKLLGTLHAAEHAMIAILPLWAMCDRWDIGGLSTNLHYQTGRPTIFVYDGHSGGVGINERGFEAFEGWVEGHGEDARRLPVRERVPVLCPVAEVREPQRAARQGRGARAPEQDARGVNMTGRLRRVLVRPPGPEFSRWREYGWRAEPDAGRIAEEHEGLRAALEDAGAEVVVADTASDGNLDAVYVYDPALSPTRARSPPSRKGRRRGEVEAMSADFAAAGVPIAAELTAPALAEGGDALWLDREDARRGPRLPDERKRAPPSSQSRCRTST